MASLAVKAVAAHQTKKLMKEKETKKKIEKIRAGPGTTVFRPIRGKYRTNPGLRHQTEQYFQGQLALKNLQAEPHFQLSPITVGKERYFTPIKEGVDTRKDSDSDSSRSFGKLTPQPRGSPILDVLTHRERMLKKGRSPLTSPKNYPGIKGTGEKAAKAAEKEFKKKLTYKKQYGGKRRKTRKRKRRRKRKTKRKKKRKRRRTRKKRGGKEKDNDKGGKRWKQMKSMKNIIDLEFDSLNLQPHYPIDTSKRGGNEKAKEYWKKPTTQRWKENPLILTRTGQRLNWMYRTLKDGIPI
jgi:hypothetical protein